MKACHNKCSSQHFMTKLGPVVLGSKPLHIFTLRKDQEDLLGALEKCKRLEFKIITSKRGTKLMVYNIENCETILRDKKNQRFLRKHGFAHFDLKAYIAYFERALSRDEMPHIMGLFFGYPLKDVIGFMEGSIKKTKVQGWCVFGDPKLSDQTYQHFSHAEEKMKTILSNRGLQAILSM